MSTVRPPAPARRARRGSRWKRLPVVRQLRQSVGLQRGMLVAGLVLTALFVLTAVFAPLLAPYEYNQLRDADGAFGAQQPPSADALARHDGRRLRRAVPRHLGRPHGAAT